MHIKPNPPNLSVTGQTQRQSEDGLWMWRGALLESHSEITNQFSVINEAGARV